VVVIHTIVYHTGYWRDI